MDEEDYMDFFIKLEKESSFEGFFFLSYRMKMFQIIIESLTSKNVRGTLAFSNKWHMLETTRPVGTNLNGLGAREQLA